MVIIIIIKKNQELEKCPSTYCSQSNWKICYDSILGFTTATNKGNHVRNVNWWKNNWWKPQKRGCTSCGLPWHPSQHVSTFSQLQYFQLQNQFDSPDKLWNRGQNSLDLVAPALQVFSLIAFSTRCNKNTWVGGRSLSDFAHLNIHYTEHVTRLIV